MWRFTGFLGLWVLLAVAGPEMGDSVLEQAVLSLMLAGFLTALAVGMFQPRRPSRVTMDRYARNCRAAAERGDEAERSFWFAQLEQAHRVRNRSRR